MDERPPARPRGADGATRDTASHRRAVPAWQWGVLALIVAILVVNVVVGVRREWYRLAGDAAERQTIALAPARATATPGMAMTPAGSPAASRAATASAATVTPASSPAVSLVAGSTASRSPVRAATVTTPATPTAAFRATDRIDAEVPVNLRAGPGTDYPAQGQVGPGTPLAATGESSTVGGILWRRFAVADGRRGWVRDIDVAPLGR